MGFLKVFIFIFAVCVIAEIFDIRNNRYSRKKRNNKEKRDPAKKLSEDEAKAIGLFLMFVTLILLLIFKPDI